MDNYFAVKRKFDIITSGFLILLLLPLFLFISVLILVMDGAPVLFRQERVGKDWKSFYLYKFRTMRSLEGNNESITSYADKRITKLGSFLRKYKLDELPQLFNVLRGDMSLVGPRPELYKFANVFKSEYNEILSVKPGITDWASIKYSNEEDIIPEHNGENYYLNNILPEKIELYKKYIRENNFATDLKIILRTIIKVFG